MGLPLTERVSLQAGTEGSERSSTGGTKRVWHCLDFQVETSVGSEARKPVLEQTMASLVAQRVKCLPAMWETRVWSLGGEDPLEKEMATHSSILAWRIPWTEEPGGLQFMGSQRSDTTERLHISHHMWTISMESAITGRCLLMKPHADPKTEVYVNTLSNGTTLRMFILGGGQARRQHTWGPGTYWNTGMTLSPGAFYRKPSTAEPQRKFQGQTDVESVSLCLWHPCLLSSGMAAAAKWEKNKKREMLRASQLTEVIQSLYVFYQDRRAAHQEIR